jgi:NAD(P)-dependent dehydrogenase (short-subunit alcohol dehydrogenase family)
MLTRSLTLEYGERGIRAYGFAPGTVRTEMQVKVRASGMNPVSRLPIEALIPPAAPAGVIAWLCTAEAHDVAPGECSIRDDALRRRAGVEVTFVS